MRFLMGHFPHYVSKVYKEILETKFLTLLSIFYNIVIRYKLQISSNSESFFDHW
jgi:hypothetical protein